MMKGKRVEGHYTDILIGRGGQKQRNIKLGGIIIEKGGHQSLTLLFVSKKGGTLGVERRQGVARVPMQ